MIEFQPKIVGFTKYHIHKKDWIIQIDKDIPDNTSKKLYDLIHIEIKDSEMPVIVRMNSDYPLEIFFFQGTKVTIRYNKHDASLNELYFDPSDIRLIQFPNV